MKKVFALVLAAALCLATLTACGGSKADAGASNPTASTSAQP